MIGVARKYSFAHCNSVVLKANSLIFIVRPWRSSLHKTFLGQAHRKFSFTVPVCVFLCSHGLVYFWMIAYSCLDVWSTCQSSHVCVLRAFASDELRFTRCALAWCLKCSDEVWGCPAFSVQEGDMCPILGNAWYKQELRCSWLFSSWPAMLRLSSFLRNDGGVPLYIKP